MIKKLILLLFLIMLVSCAAQNQVPPSPIPIPVKITVDHTGNIQTIDPQDRVQKTLAVEDPSLQLSNYTRIINNQAIMTIFSGLSVSDWRNLVGDLCYLKLNGIKLVDIHIYSPGGDAFAGLALADVITKAKKDIQIISHATGIIASAAVPVFAACSKRYAAPSTIFMVHEASIFKYFSNESKSDLRSQNNMMQLLEEKYVNMLVKNSNKSFSDWVNLSEKTTWFTSDQALEWGLVDEIE